MPAKLSEHELMYCLPDIGLADLTCRCHRDGECLVWNQYASNDGALPQWHLNGRIWSARQLVWLLTRGPMPRGRKSRRAHMRCGNALCLNPDHMVAKTMSAATKGKKKSLLHRMRISAARRRAAPVITAEVAEMIRSSPLPASHLDAQLGISYGQSARVRRGEIWRTDIGTPFDRGAGPW